MYCELGSSPRSRTLSVGNIRLKEARVGTNLSQRGFFLSFYALHILSLKWGDECFQKSALQAISSCWAWRIVIRHFPRLLSAPKYAPSNYGDIIGLLMPLCADAKLSDNAAVISGRPTEKPPRFPPAAWRARTFSAAAAVIKMPSGDVFGA